MRSRNNLARAPRSPRKTGWFRERNFWNKIKKINKIQMKIRLISMISLQSKDVVNVYIKFRLLRFTKMYRIGEKDLV